MPIPILPANREREIVEELEQQQTHLGQPVVAWSRWQAPHHKDDPSLVTFVAVQLPGKLLEYAFPLTIVDAAPDPAPAAAAVEPQVQRGAGGKFVRIEAPTATGRVTE
jgi:hypothetical protein